MLELLEWIKVNQVLSAFLGINIVWAILSLIIIITEKSLWFSVPVVILGFLIINCTLAAVLGFEAAQVFLCLLVMTVVIVWVLY